jgi:hypothetical protein
VARRALCTIDEWVTTLKMKNNNVLRVYGGLAGFDDLTD